MDEYLEDYISIDNEYYDPYHILGVSHHDSDEIIKSAFKKRAKKYHPDKLRNLEDHEAYHRLKKKHEHRFEIIMASYEYIKAKRHSSQKVKERSERSERSECRSERSECRSERENKHVTQIQEPSDTVIRLETIDEYKRIKDDIETKMVNQFKKKKYNARYFNDMFEYLKELAPEKEEELSLIHRTTDGFYGNTSMINNNNAIISTYGGLIVTAEDQIDHDTNLFSDYSKTYNKAKNPQQIIQPKKIKEFVQSRPNKIYNSITSQDIHKKKEDLKLASHSTPTTFNEENDKLYKKTLKNLLDKEERDRQTVLKYGSQYDKHILRQAMNGELEQSPSLLEALHQHYKTIKDAD